MRQTDLLLRPIITEKSLVLVKDKNTYSFEVNKAANKNQIKAVVEEEFSVKVIDLKTAILSEKTKRQKGSRNKLTRIPAKKKAMIKLKEGDKIDLFELSK